MSSDRLRLVRDQRGFTLVELLVVMLILAILAAIAIPSFFNQRDKAKDTKAKGVAKAAQTAMETFATNNEGFYTGATVAELEAIEAALVGGDLSVDAVGADNYRLTTTSGSGNNFTVIRQSDGSLVLDCTTRGTGGCPASAGW